MLRDTMAGEMAPVKNGKIDGRKELSARTPDPASCERAPTGDGWAICTREL